MLKKIELKTLVFQITALFFLVNGLKRLYFAQYSEIYEAIIEEDFEYLRSVNDISYSEILLNQALWPFAGFLVGGLIIGFVNWRYKISILNSIIIFAIIFFLFPLGLFNDGFIQQAFNSFCYVFSEKMGKAFFVGGLSMILISFMFFTMSILQIKNHRSSSSVLDENLTS